MNQPKMKETVFWVLSALLLLLIMAVGPLDLFSHGYFYDEINITEAEDDLDVPYDLSQGDYVMHFSPAKKHFAGMEILLTNQPAENSGSLFLTVAEESGKTLETVEVDLSKVKEKVWYKTYTHTKLKKGEHYTLTFSVRDCNTIPSLVTINRDYLKEETIDGNAALSYAYAKSTFAFREKVLISFFLISIWLWLYASLMTVNKENLISGAALFIFMVGILTWNYMYNSMDNANTGFKAFQADSESLVTGPVLAEKNGIGGLNGFGLGWYYNSLGTDRANSISPVDDANWNRGYSKTDPEILVNSNAYLKPYPSQFGLQGKILRRIARFNDNVENLHLLCALGTAVIFAVIVFLLAAKYNAVLAATFFMTFWLSPWIVNFARNLYWVEFTWFIPMAIGLFCSWKIDDKKCRTGSYIAAYVAITIKCLCGYEYITTVMMGLIAFLLVDLVVATSRGDKGRSGRLFRTIFILGVAALLGFIAAICIHAPLRADGNLLKGIVDIFESDVLRRTAGADLNDFAPVYWPSINASIWEVLCKYFKFPTSVVTGVTGNLFPLICCIPLAIFVSDHKKKKLNIELVAMYSVFFFTSVSWFVLAKSHSYIHTHMNYVLWYFGFVQTCFYVMLTKLMEICRELRGENGK